MRNKIKDSYRKRNRARQVQKESDKAEESLNNIVNTFLAKLDDLTPDEQTIWYMEHKKIWRDQAAHHNLFFKVTRCRIAAFDDKLNALIKMHKQTNTFKKEVKVLENLLKRAGVVDKKENKFLFQIKRLGALLKSKITKGSVMV